MQDVNIIEVIYIDQPIGAGFSFGNNDTVNSTASAAPFVWEAFQILFESGQFSKFKSREFVCNNIHDSLVLCFPLTPHTRFIFATESYGGHYGPSFVTFFDEQNAKIEAGQITGEKITVSALMISK